MKKVLSFILAAVMGISLAVPAFAGTVQSVVSSDTSYNNVIGGVSFIERAGMKAELEALMSGDACPSGVIFNVDSDLNVVNDRGEGMGYTLREAVVILDGIARPIVKVSDDYTACAVCTFFEYSGVNDFYIMSASAELLAHCREEYPIGATVLDMTDITAVPTVEELRAISADSNRVGANVVLLPSECVTSEVVKYLYIRTVYTWLETEDDLDTMSAAELILTGTFAVVSRDTDVLSNVATEVLPENTLTRSPINVGHRGSPLYAPDNTVEGCLLAEEQGADAVEIDVFITADGEIILNHDLTYKGVDLEANTLAQIRAAGIDLPLLQDIYENIERETFIFLEIKSSKPEIVPAIVELTKEYGFADKLLVISFNYDQLLLMRETFPEVPCSVLKGTLEDYSMEGIIEAFRKDSISVAPAYYNDFSVVREEFNSYFATETHTRALPIFLWTFISEKIVDDFFVTGFLGMTADIPDYTGSHAISVDPRIEGDIIPGKECEVSYDAYDYTGKKARARRLSITSDDEKVTVNKKNVTFAEAGEYKLLVSAEVGTSVGSYSISKVITVSVPSGTVTTPSDELLYADSVYSYADSSTLGDVNSDGSVDLRDASMLIKYLGGYDGAIDCEVSDLNGDMSVDFKDVSALIRVSAGY